MDAIRTAIAKITNVARQKFGDNQGFVQNNRLTMQPIRQAISTPSDLMYTATKLSPYRATLGNMNRDQYKQAIAPITQQYTKLPRPIQKFGEGFVEGSTVGLSDVNVAPSRNLGEKLAYGGGYVASMVNPLNPMNKVAGVLKGTQAIKGAQMGLGKLASQGIARGGLAKLGGLAVKGASQGLPYTAAYAGLNAATRDPQEAGKGVAMDLGIDAAIGALPIVGSLAIANKGAVRNLPKRVTEMVDKVKPKTIKNLFDGDLRTVRDILSSEQMTVEQQIKGRYLLGDLGLNPEIDNQTMKQVMQSIHNRYEQLNPRQIISSSRTKLDKQGNVIYKGASQRQQVNPHIAQARQYPTAEEFVKAQGTPLYHGTNAEFKVFDKNKIGTATDEGLYGKGFYFGNTESFASVAPKGRPAKNVMKVYPSKDINLFEISKIESVEEMADLLNMSESALTKESSGIIRPVRDQVGQFTSHLKELGYDGVVVNRGGDAIETVIFEPEKIRAEGQLTDIWNEANSKGGMKRSPPVEMSGAMAGIESYQDENGNTQYKFNPIKGMAGIAGMKVAKDGRLRAFTQTDVPSKPLLEQLKEAQTNVLEGQQLKQYADSVWEQFAPDTRKSISSIRKQLDSLEKKGADMTNVSLSKSYKKGFDDVMATLGTDSEDEALDYIKNLPDRQVKGLGQEQRIATNLSKQMQKQEMMKMKQASITNTAADASLLNEGVDQAKLKTRGFIDTVQGAGMTQTPLAKKIGGQYEVITNPETMRSAKQQIASNIDKARERVFSKGDYDADVVAIGQELMRKAQIDKQWTEAANIAETLAMKATKAGQGNQALSIWGRMTPEGMLQFAVKTIKKANEDQGIITKGIKKVLKIAPTRLDDKAMSVIDEAMRMANSAKSEEDKVKYVRIAMDEIQSHIPYGVSDLLDEMRYNNTLSGPLTHARNAWSNTLQATLVRPTVLALEGKPQDVVKYYGGIAKSVVPAVEKAVSALKGNVAYKPLEMELKGGLRPKPRLGLYNIPTRLLEASDQFFTTMIKGGEMARGVSGQEAGAIAEGLLFRSATHPKGQGHLLNKIDDVIDGVSQLRSKGNLSWFLLFLRTPMNVAKQWIEYSPAGLATIPGSANKREQLAKAVVGSMVTLMGAKLALDGRTTWSAPDDPTEKKLFYDSGRKPYSVKIGDKWVPMQYLGTFAWAAGIPAAMQHYQSQDRKALTSDQTEKITQALFSLGGFWSQQTFVSGLGSFVNTMQGKDDYTLTKSLAYTAGQINPMAGLQRYIATVIDPIFRKPKTFTQQIQSGIPGMTKNLPYYETSTGEPATRNITNYVAPYPMGLVNDKFEQPYQDRHKRIQENALINAYDSGKSEFSQEQAKDVLTIKAKRDDQDATIRLNKRIDTALKLQDPKKRASKLKAIRNDVISEEKLTETSRARLLKDLPEQSTTITDKTKKTKVKKPKKAKKAKVKKLKMPKLSAKLPKTKKTKVTKVKLAKTTKLKAPKLARIKVRQSSNLT